VAAVQDAFMHGWTIAMATGAAVLTAAAVATIRTPRPAGTDTPASTTADTRVVGREVLGEVDARG
jgi:hypothetical protein